MPNTVIQTSGRKYTFSPDDTAPLCNRMWGLLQARIVDASTGNAVRGGITLTSDIPSAVSVIRQDGIVGIVGIPRETIPAIAVKNFTIKLDIRAEGYRPAQVTLNYPPDRRAIAAPRPLAGSTVITMNVVANLLEGEDLLVGPPGQNMRLVTLVSLGPGPADATVSPALLFDYAIGDPVVPVVPQGFRTLYLGDMPLQPEP